MRITSIIRTTKNCTKLTGEFKYADDPPRLKDIKMYPHQKVAVRALLDLEKKKIVYAKRNGAIQVIQSNSIILSEPFGSGKTIEILCLIMISPVPRAYPDHINILYPKYINTFKHEIVRKFIGPKALIRSNLVIVSAGILNQWKTLIDKYTDMRVLVIGNYYSLETFRQEYLSNRLHYDIILLKKGFVSMKTPDKNKNTMISAIEKITIGSCWARVIYDDFDISRTVPKNNIINSLSNIFVSTTRLKYNIKKYGYQEYTSVVDLIRSNNTKLYEISNDDELFRYFNVQCKSSFIKQSICIPIIESFSYTYINPDDNYLRLINIMDANNPILIIEMLNGDAIDTAAEALGISTKSIADIFQKMLDDKYDRYMKSIYVLEYISHLRKNIIPNLSISSDYIYSDEELAKIEREIIGCCAENIGVYTDKLEDCISKIQKEYTSNKEHDGIAITRVIENVKQGECQICYSELTNGAFIAKCCGLIVCGVCGIKGSKMVLSKDDSTCQQHISGRCAHCRRDILLESDLIYLDRSFNIKTILEARGDEQMIVEQKSNDDHYVAPKNPKLDAIYQIVNGREPTCRVKISRKIKELLVGNTDIKQDNSRISEKKVLIFAAYNETLEKIRLFLTENGVPNIKLCGSHQEITNSIKKFRYDGRVLLVNSMQYCAGIDLGFCTDLIFYHKIFNTHIEKQAIGRIQRIGRTCNAHVHYLSYTNEEI